MFKKCPNLKGKLFLQDGGHPPKNSCKNRSTKVFYFLNHIFEKKLHQDALERLNISF